MRKFCPASQDIRRLILWLHEQKYSYHHVVNTSLAIEHYCAFKGWKIRLGRPRKPKRIIKDVLTESQISRLIQGTRNIRQKAIICLLAYSGMRNSEICNLMVKDLDLVSNRVIVLAGKNNKDRIINISAECTNVLIDYLGEIKRNRDDYLFSTVLKKNKLHSSDLRKILRTVGKRHPIADLPQQFLLHKLIHLKPNRTPTAFILLHLDWSR